MWQGGRRKPAQKNAQPLRRTLDARGKLARSEVARRRTKVQMLKGALAIIALTTFVGGLSWLSFADVLAVQRIVVEGNSDIKTRALQASVMLATADARAGLFSQQNTLLYPSAELEQLLTFEFPKIATIDINAQPAKHQVVIAVTEREPYAVWCRDALDCYFVDEDGLIFEQAATTTGLVRFYGGVTRTRPIRSSVAPEYFTAVRDVLNDLETLGLTVHTFSFQGEDAMLEVAPGWELRLALDKDLGAAAFNLAAVLDEYDLRSQLENIAYIDMRFDERVYYKLKKTES